MRIIQLINALDPGDAVSLHLMEIDRMLRGLGHETEIYSEHAHPDVASKRRPVGGLSRDHADLLLFHYAGYSNLLGSVAEFRGRRGVIYHNITPARFFEGMDETHAFCEKGHRQLATLPQIFHFGIGVSGFNCEALRAAGFSHTRILPIPADIAELTAVEPAAEILDRYDDGAINVLCVGRVAPHKGALEAVAALGALRDREAHPVRLLLLGRNRGYEPYLDSVRREIRRLGLEDSVVIAGEVTSAELRAHYECASVLLLLSEHEGFAVSVLEAMLFDVPVVAFGAAAVPETLGGAGRLLESRDPQTVAAALREAVSPGDARRRALSAQRARVAEFSREKIAERLAETLDWATELPAPASALSFEPSFSVVVCTYNRGGILGKCLDALRRLDWPRYEVVVVNGPSTDETESVLSRFGDIKRVDNPQRNLSISRNLGIAASAGEIVAFIDDDAVPDTDWLARLAEPYRDPTVGAAGGRVFGPGGDHLQFDNGIISRNGMPVAIQDSPDRHNSPDAEWYNILMGTNSSFRRAALEEVGGFDENYEYYHDESDLCVRVIKAGYRVVHVPDACVWHEFEKSRIRKSVRDVNWSVVVKNTIYFYFKNNRWRRRPLDWGQPMRAALVHFGIFSRWFVRGEIGPRRFAKASLRWAGGCALGYAKGVLRPPRRHLGRRADVRASKLMQYGRPAPRWGAEPIHVALISQQYAPDACGGIGVYTEQLARGLVAAGHRVSVIARGAKESTVWRDGVKVYRVPDSPVRGREIPASYRVVRKNAGRSLAVHRLVTKLVRSDRLRLVESPLWDAEAFATSLEREVPLLIRLNTPMAMAIETQAWRRTDDLRLACEMEWTMLRGASGWIDTSGTIVETLNERYGVRPNGLPVREIPFGVEAPPPSSLSRERAGGPTILFVGRLEARKGIDTLLRAIPHVLKDHPEARLLLAGGCPDGARLQDDFFRRYREPGAREHVRFLGHVSDAELEDLYATSDIFVAPSRYESFGLVYLEAMAHGLPVVACRVGGAKSVIVDQKTGLLVPPDDAASLARAVATLRERGNEIAPRIGGATAGRRDLQPR